MPLKDEDEGAKTVESESWLQTHYPLVAERLPRRAGHRELAADPNRERQSRYCQGFDPDWWVPAKLALKWLTWFYPQEATLESVKQWRNWIEALVIEYGGPFAVPERAKELEAELQNDLDLIRRCRPELVTVEYSDIKQEQPRRGMANPPDGPEPPHWLRWKGKRHRIGKGRAKRSWELLDYFWERDSAPYEELQGPGKPWPDPVSDSAMVSAVNRFNNDLPHDFPWRLATKHRCIAKESRENPPR